MLVCLQSYKIIIIHWSQQTGWMMWNWLVSALAVGASVVLYDGSPFIPSPNVIWDLVDKIGWDEWQWNLVNCRAQPCMHYRHHVLNHYFFTDNPLRSSLFWALSPPPPTSRFLFPLPINQKLWNINFNVIQCVYNEVLDQYQYPYPSPNPTLTLTCYQLTVVELGEG